MALGPRSVLGKLSPDKTQASSALAAASRQARQAFVEQSCDGVDEVLATSRTIANEMGIPVEQVNALLDVKGGTFSGGAIALHDEDQVPLKNLGSGSMRLLVAGLQKIAGHSSISIIDEAEFGLEPYSSAQRRAISGPSWSQARTACTTAQSGSETSRATARLG